MIEKPECQGCKEDFRYVCYKGLFSPHSVTVILNYQCVDCEHKVTEDEISDLLRELKQSKLEGVAV